MAWGAIGAALLGQAAGDASSGFASAAQYAASKHERNVAWRRAQAWELMAPGLRMAGLKAAGLNPILAVSHGLGGGASHVPQGGPGGTPSFSRDSVSKAIEAGKQAKMFDLQVREQEANTLFAERQADAARFLPETKQAERDGAWGTSREIGERVNLLLRQQGEVSARTTLYDQDAAKRAVERKLLEADVPSAQALEALYKKYPWLRQIGAAAKDVFGR